MRRMKFVFFIALITVVASDSFAQESSKKIAAIDMARIFTESKAVQDIQRQVKKKGDSFQKEITGLEDIARAEAEKLEKEKEQLSHLMYAQRQEEIQKKVVTFQNLAIDRKEQVDKAYMQAMDQVKDAFQVVLGQVAKERGVAIVHPVQQVVYMDPDLALDITDLVMDKLDKKLPKVPVVFQKSNDNKSKRS